MTTKIRKPHHKKPAKAWHPSASAIFTYIKNHGWKQNKRTISRATKALEAKHKSNPHAKDISIHQSAADWQVIYGRMQVGGTLTYEEISNDHSKLYLLITIAGHEIDAIEKVFVDNVEITFGPSWGWSTGPNQGGGVNFTNKIYAQPYLGDPSIGSSQPYPQLQTDSGGKWSAAHQQRGRAGIYLKFLWDSADFPGGMPEIYFQVRGKKPYDPRSGLSIWTANAALCIADYMTDPNYGGKFASSDLDMSSLGDAANICDLIVTNADGSTEQTYNVHGAFDSKESPGNLVANMCSAMGGTVTYVEGKIHFWPAFWRAPTLTLTLDDILSDITVTTLVSRADSFNKVKGIFASDRHGYEVTDFPVISNTLYYQQDSSEEVIHDLALPFTTSGTAAQRLGKIELERARQQIGVEFVAILRAYQAQPPENLMLTLADEGWSSKVFEVEDSAMILESKGQGPFFACRLKLRETAQGVFDYNHGNETTVDFAPDSNLPNPNEIFDPSLLTLQSGTAVLFKRSDGTIFSAILASWVPPADAFVTSGGHYNVQKKKSSDSTWLADLDVEGSLSQTRILDVQDGVAYDVRIRSVNAFGTPGQWVYAFNHIVVGKNQAPSDVLGFAAQVNLYGIDFTWAAIPDIDAAYYELREGSTWETAAYLGKTASLHFTLNFRRAGSVTFLIKAIDTTGNYSANATAIISNIPIPDAPAGTFEVSGADIIFRWSEPNSVFAIDGYLFYQGADFSTATNIAFTKASSFRERVNFGGTQDFWVAARDVAGNIGNPFHYSITIVPPAAPQNLSAVPVDNDAFLRWLAPSAGGTLPVAGYGVYKGAVFFPDDTNLTTKIGDVTGTFEAIIELVGGVYTYWVAAFDTAGNRGAPASISVRIANPPDFVLLTDEGVEPLDAYLATNLYIPGFGALTVTGASGGGSPIGILVAITGTTGGSSGSPVGLLMGITQ